MNILKSMFYELNNYNYEILSNVSFVVFIYFLVFFIIFLENSILPAAFLPGDSLLILIGVLISQGILNFPIALGLVTVAAVLGSWMSYLQGRWLENSKLIKNWLNNLPHHYYVKAYRIFYHHGLFALFIGRFLAFVRTLLPVIAGLSGLGSSRFHLFNCISAFLWVFILTLIGFFLGKTSFFQVYQEKLMLFLIFLPILFFIIGFFTYLFLFLRKK